MNAVMKFERTVKLDPELRATDELADRYFRNCYFNGGGSRHPLETIRMLHDGAVLGGGPTGTVMSEDEVAFDNIYATAPAREKATLTAWYTTGGSCQQKADRQGISKSTLYLLWKTALSYFRGRLHAKGIKV